MTPVELTCTMGDNPPTAKLYYGQDNRKTLKELPDQSVHMIATSPPYYGLRDYGTAPVIFGGLDTCEHVWGNEIPGDSRGGSGTPTDKNNRGESYARGHSRGQVCSKCGARLCHLGLEPTPEEYVQDLVEVFREARRVLRDDGTLWLNLGDSWAGGGGGNYGISKSTLTHHTHPTQGRDKPRIPKGLKSKDLIGIPWRVAFALQEDGWYLRQDIIWFRNNTMPESVTDRCTKSHEYVFLLTKSPKYFYDYEAIKEPCTEGTASREESAFIRDLEEDEDSCPEVIDDPIVEIPRSFKNKRSVWTINNRPYKGAHFAVFPEDLVEPMILAGTSQKGCCPSCGKSWVRVMEREDRPTVRSANPENPRDGGLTKEQGIECTGMTHHAYAEWLAMHPPKTVGWKPACNCQSIESN